MRKLSFTVIMAMLLIAGHSASTSAGWLIFHKPEFKGKVIDAETKAPITGAVVVVVYYKHVYNPAGGKSSVVKVKETLTDDNGMFSFPSYTTIIHPFSREDDADFTIYKPGYGSFPRIRKSPPSGISTDTKERFFWAKKFGKQGEIRVTVKTGGEWKDTKQKVIFGVVELPALKTRKERLDAIPGAPTDITSKELPLLFKAMNRENNHFGLGIVK